MKFDPYPEYLTVAQAAAYRGVSQATIRRLLRQYGLGEFMRDAMNKQVLIRKQDLDGIEIATAPGRPGAARRPGGRRSGAA